VATTEYFDKYRSCAIVRYSGAGVTVGTGDGGEVVVPFATEDVDLLSEYNTSTYRFTATYAGQYLVVGEVYWADTVDGSQYRVTVRVNGSTYYGLKTYSKGTGDFNIPFSVGLNLAASDYVEITVQQYTGGNRTLSQGGEYDTRCSFMRIR
jgi:hypothetical protein